MRVLQVARTRLGNFFQPARIRTMGRALVPVALTITAPLTLTGCVSEGLEDTCSASKDVPEAGDLFIHPSAYTPQNTIIKGTPAPFILTSAQTCSKETAGLEVKLNVCDYDLSSEGINNYNLPMEKNADGSYSATVGAFNWGGCRAIATVTDLARGTSKTVIKYDLPYVEVPSEPSATPCSSIPGPDSIGPTTNTPIVQGSDTVICWEQIYTDCHNEPLLDPVSDAVQYLHLPQFDYNGKTISICGPILPLITGGAMRVDLKDNDGNSKIVLAHLPTINPPVIESSENYFQQYQVSNFYLMQEISGARKYSIVVDAPNGPEDAVNQFSSLFSYAPPQYGPHSIYYYITPYTNNPADIFDVSKFFNVHESAAEAPIPALVAIHNPSSGIGSGYNIDFNGSGSYSPIGASITSFDITYGDSGQGPDESNITGIFFHTYPNPGPGNNAGYNACLKVTDGNFMSSSICVPVSVWGD